MVWRAGLHGLLPGRPSSAQRPADGLGPLRPYPHCLVPDTNVFLHEIDFLEDPAIRNVIVLQIVLDELGQAPQPERLPARLREVIADTPKRFYVFANEHRRESYVQRDECDTPQDRNDLDSRCVSQMAS